MEYFLLWQTSGAYISHMMLHAYLQKHWQNTKYRNHSFDMHISYIFAKFYCQLITIPLINVANDKCNLPAYLLVKTGAALAGVVSLVNKYFFWVQFVVGCVLECVWDIVDLEWCKTFDPENHFLPVLVGRRRNVFITLGDSEKYIFVYLYRYHGFFN